MKIISEQSLKSLFHWKNEDKSLGNVKYIICYIFEKMQEIRASEANIDSFQQILVKYLPFPTPRY